MCTFKKPSYHQRECFINEFPKQTLKQIGKRLQTCLEHRFCWKLFIFMKNALFSIRYFYSYFCSPLFLSYRIKIPNIWGGRHKNAIFRLYKSLYPQKWKNVVTDKLWHMNGIMKYLKDTLWFWVICVLPKYFPPSEWRWTCGKKNVICLCFFYLLLKLKSLINDGR